MGIIVAREGWGNIVIGKAKTIVNGYLQKSKVFQLKKNEFWGIKNNSLSIIDRAVILFIHEFFPNFSDYTVLISSIDISSWSAVGNMIYS